MTVRALAIVTLLGLGAACQKGTPADPPPTATDDPAHRGAIDPQTSTATVDTPGARADQDPAGRPAHPPEVRRNKVKQIPAPLEVATPPEDAERSPSGLILKHLVRGKGRSPAANDSVMIKYTAWKLDGSTFATTEPGTAPTTMPLYSVAPGFSEALQTMKPGGTAMFWLPPEIGYPGQPRPNAETLAYAVELVEVVPGPVTPRDVAKPPADARAAPSGVRWKVVKRSRGKAARPRPWDAVSIVYTGWDSTGTIIDTNEGKDQPVRLPLDALPASFADAVPQLGAGERARLWIPAAMMNRGPDGTLCFEVQVIAVHERVRPPDAPADVAAPPPDALTTPKGVSYKVLDAPGGTRKPQTSDEVTVHYTGWTTDGKRFDSSIPDATPKVFRVTGVIAGWTDALLHMNVGDTWRVWIPEELAYKGAPNRPQGMLVFDVQLLEAQPPAPPAGPHPR
jgi:FKBP-type peptidyl-prolyl cis-trans isomerase